MLKDNVFVEHDITFLGWLHWHMVDNREVVGDVVPHMQEALLQLGSMLAFACLHLGHWWPLPGQLPAVALLAGLA